jgi:hypothetical protein
MALEEESEVVLTPRELAIARDEDPDTVETEEIVDPVTDELNGSATEGAEDQETENKDVPESWIDDSAKELGASYGLDEETLKLFSSADEFRKAAVLFDRLVTKAEPVKQEPPKETPAEKAERLELDIEKYKPEEYDEDTIKLVKFAKQLQDDLQAQRAQVDPMVQFIQRLQEERVVEEYRGRLNAFHDAVDEIDPTLVGRSRDEKTGRFASLDAKHNEARKKIFDAADALARGLQAKGQELPPMKVLVKRAAQMELGEELTKLEALKRQKELEAQSKKRRPVAVARPVAGSTKQTGKRSMSDEVSEIANLPELVRMWEEKRV